MKAKPIFYQNGNDRRFEDQHTISVMTGEPMPRKWQDFFELTPEEKARWDAELKLDEEYRIAETQGFPNGIPGGRTRGDILHYFTQQEEAREKRMQEDSFLRRPFIPQKTEIQNNNSIASSNTLAYEQSNAQPSFTFNRKLNTESPYIGQNNLLQMNTGIKKDPDIDLDRAIHRAGDLLKATLEYNNGQTDTNLVVPNEQGNSLMDAFNQKYYNAVALSYGNGSSPLGVTGNHANSRMATDIGYSNGRIFSSNEDDISAMVEDFMKELARKVKAELTGIAATIIAVVTAKWKFGRDITVGADTMIMVLALSHVARQTQFRWEREKSTKKDTSVAKVFGEEAMKCLVEEGVGNFIKRKHSSEILAFIASMMAGDLIDEFLEQNTPRIFPHDVKTWERYIKEKILD